ncbi:MAG: hypothetical protein PHR25_03100 [Clostridia bacterium]|nr:hypothetical protein [Clostridia bacterium]MDD4375748.1 hypothetical protein [Clostridia bacterium]
MKRNSFIDFILKNKYTIIFVTIVLVLVWLGIIKLLLEIGFTVLLILLAIYIGKRIQEDSEYIKKMFNTNEDDVIYKVKKDEEDE